MTNCFACDVNSGRIAAPGGTIYEDAHWIADHGVDRLVRGYVVLKPRRHVHELADLDPAEASGLGPVLRRLVAAMRSGLGTERVYTCSFAETVPHLHFHLLPRYPDMPALGPQLVPDLFEGRWACTQREAEAATKEIRAALVNDVQDS
jgi:diadenosine tetraphosphate (Ap4A) HIT family hydrolase